jgi:hypothetical protein
MATKSKARTIAEFKAAHDQTVIIPNKIRAAIEKLAEIGPEHYEYEADFLRAASVSNNVIGQYRDKFADYWVEIPNPNGGGKGTKRVWFGDKKVAARVRLPK